MEVEGRKHNIYSLEGKKKRTVGWVTKDYVDKQAKKRTFKKHCFKGGGGANIGGEKSLNELCFGGVGGVFGCLVGR